MYFWATCENTHVHAKGFHTFSGNIVEHMLIDVCTPNASTCVFRQRMRTYLHATGLHTFWGNTDEHVYVSIDKVGGIYLLFLLLIYASGDGEGGIEDESRSVSGFLHFDTASKGKLCGH